MVSWHVGPSRNWWQKAPSGWLLFMLTSKFTPGPQTRSSMGWVFHVGASRWGRETDTQPDLQSVDYLGDLVQSLMGKGVATMWLHCKVCSSLIGNGNIDLEWGLPNPRMFWLFHFEFLWDTKSMCTLLFP